MIGDRRPLPARVPRDDRASCGRSSAPPTSRSPALIVAAYFGTAFNILLVLAASFPLHLRLRRRPPPPRRDRRLDGRDAARHRLDRHPARPRGAAPRPARATARRCSSTSWSAPSPPTPAPTRPGACSAPHKIAPSLSPNKTLEGLIGGFLIGTMAFWFAGLYQDWLSGADALIIGAAVAAVAPVGDLFESMLKRDLGTKDTGRLFGPHGGVARPPRRRPLHGRGRLLPLRSARLLRSPRAARPAVPIL